MKNSITGILIALWAFNCIAQKMEIQGDPNFPDTVVIIKVNNNTAVGLSVSNQGSGLGILGKSPNGIGVVGQSATSNGVFGSSTSSAGVHGSSKMSSGIFGYSDVSAGVWGASHDSYGLRGYSDNSVGIYGYGSNANGIHGHSPNHFGVYGSSDNEVGVSGYSINFSGVRGWSDHSVGAVGYSGNVNSYDFNAEGPGINYGSTSSRRWKQNIIHIPDPLIKISHLRGVYFDWDEAHGGHHDVGFIAEEVGEVLPEIVVYEKNGTDASGLDYSKLTPLLVEAMNALQKKIEKLENLMNEQREEIRWLKAGRE